MKTKKAQWRRGLAVAWLSVCMAGSAWAGPRLGSSVTLRVNGDAEYRSPEKTAELTEGLALSQGHTILPKGVTYVDAAITMGGILRVLDGNDLYLKQLEQRSEGLPGSDKEYSRAIVLEMSRGSLFVNAGDACDCLELIIETPMGEIRSSGSRFIVSRQDGRWVVKGITGDTVLAPRNTDEETTLGEDRTGAVGGTLKDPQVETFATPADDPQVAQYHIFWSSTEALEEELMCLGEQGCVCFDCFTDWMANNLPQEEGGVRSSPPLQFMGDPLQWFDVSPAARR